jgi:crotonobetaine/carnitine-CoA ligase
VKREYKDLHPNFANPSDWTLATVLRHHAAERPEATCLKTPEEGASWTYAEILDESERVAAAWRAAGAQAGERVLIMAMNSSRLVRSWFGTALSGLVEVPINTAYEGEFLRHQTMTVQPRWAVIDDVFAVRFIAIEQHARQIERFWVIDTGQAAEAIELLGRHGWRASHWDEVLEAEPDPQPAPEATSLASIFFTSGTTGPSKGVAMPHSQMYFFGQEVVSLTRLTAEDTYLTCTPLFHGNAQFMAAYPALIAGAAVAVRPKFSASRWAEHLRESDVTVTNLVGVMMDFVWKAAARDDDANNSLRCVYAAPTASSILEDFMKRFGVEAFVDAFGLTETCAPILLVRDPPGRPGHGPRGTDRPDRRARRPVQAALDVQPRVLRHAREDGGGVAQPVVPHRRRAASGRRGLVLLCRPVQGCAAQTRGKHQLVRGRAGAASAPERSRMRSARCTRGSRRRRGRGAGRRRH